MIFRDMGTTILIVILVVAGAGTAWSVYRGKHDSVFEEHIEDVIEEELGVDIDLTPATPE